MLDIHSLSTHAGEDEESAGAAAMMVMLHNMIMARQARSEHRKPHQLYLCRRELMPNPRIDTPWQRLWESQEDRAFITTMGFDVKTFRLMLEGPNRFGDRWNTQAIPRNDVKTHGKTRIGSRSLDGAGALGLVLHYLGSAMLEVSLQQIFAITPSVLSRYLDFAQDILYNTLHFIKEAAISMPRKIEEFEKFSNLIHQRHSLLCGAFGSIDGLSLAAQESEDPEMENATYNGWKSDHCINNVLVFAPDGQPLHLLVSSALLLVNLNRKK